MAVAGGRLCYLALGGNVGDRLRYLSRAVRRVAELDGVHLRRTSSLFQTAPQYVTEQPSFLNAVAEVELSATRLSDLHGLLADFKAIEADLGRVPGQRRGPRVVDLDLIAVGEERLVLTECKYPLSLPHAHMHERDFVLVPMAELRPDWRHPSVEGQPTVRQMLTRVLAGEEGASSEGARPDEHPRRVFPAAGGLGGRKEGVLWEQGTQTRIMGILNITPDSFSDGGNNLKLEDAVTSAQAMADAGASIIDVGGETTKPGASEVSSEEEIRRVVPVIRALRERGMDLTISVDTRKAAVARAAIQAGADWINDVSGGEFDPEMLRIAADLMVPIVLMHMKGTPETMNSMINYSSVVDEVRDHLIARRRAAEDAGVPSWNVILDPGIGFAKKLDENLALLRCCGDLVSSLQPSPVLISASRKRFLGTILGEPDAKQRTFGNAATTAAAVAAGVDVVRAHEVRAMFQTARVSDHIHRPLYSFRTTSAF